MKKLTILSIIMIALFSLPACGRAYGSADIPSVDDGRKLYAAKCARCHGVDGSGLGAMGGSVGDLRAQTLGEKYQFNMALVSRAILDGIDNNGNDLNSAMPRFRNKLSVADTKSIIVFMQSLRVPPEPPTDDGNMDMPPSETTPADGGKTLTPDIPKMRP